MFLIAGWERHFRTIRGGVTRRCSNCGRQAEHRELERATRLTAFFFPIGSVGGKTYLSCTKCGFTRQESLFGDAIEALDSLSNLFRLDRQFERISIEGILARGRSHEADSNVDEIGSCSLALDNRGFFDLQQSGEDLQRAHLSQMSLMERGDYREGPDPAGSWIRFRFIDPQKSDAIAQFLLGSAPAQSWTIIKIEPPGSADEFLETVATWGEDLSIGMDKRAV